MKPLPVRDEEFWIVTAIALVAAAYLAWSVLGPMVLGRRRSRRHPKATLTIEGRAVGSRKSDEA